MYMGIEILFSVYFVMQFMQCFHVVGVVGKKRSRMTIFLFLSILAAEPEVICFSVQIHQWHQVQGWSNFFLKKCRFCHHHSLSRSHRHLDTQIRCRNCLQSPWILQVVSHQDLLMIRFCCCCWTKICHAFDCHSVDFQWRRNYGYLLLVSCWLMSHLQMISWDQLSLSWSQSQFSIESHWHQRQGNQWEENRLLFQSN